MSDIQTNPEEFRKMAENQIDGPVVMVNLLKFKGNEGRSSYALYTKEAGKFVEEVGGKVIYLGRTGELLNGSERWDMIMLIQYPSRKSFLAMANNPEYLKIHHLREEGLERAVLYTTDPMAFREIACRL